jgi:hypothetical protein
MVKLKQEIKYAGSNINNRLSYQINEEDYKNLILDIEKKLPKDWCVENLGAKNSFWIFMPSIKGGASYKQKKERYKKLNFLLD